MARVLKSRMARRHTLSLAKGLASGPFDFAQDKSGVAAGQSHRPADHKQAIALKIVVRLTASPGCTILYMISGAPATLAANVLPAQHQRASTCQRA
jgi:hypothetical protein